MCNEQKCIWYIILDAGMSKIEDLVSEEGFLNVSTYNKKVKGKKAWVWE
jgi:hypothetical protein